MKKITALILFSGIAASGYATEKPELEVFVDGTSVTAFWKVTMAQDSYHFYFAPNINGEYGEIANLEIPGESNSLTATLPIGSSYFIAVMPSGEDFSFLSDVKSFVVKAPADILPYVSVAGRTYYGLSYKCNSGECSWQQKNFVFNNDDSVEVMGISDSSSVTYQYLLDNGRIVLSRNDSQAYLANLGEGQACWSDSFLNDGEYCQLDNMRYIVESQQEADAIIAEGDSNELFKALGNKKFYADVYLGE